jgi:hypothetical protein
MYRSILQRYKTSLMLNLAGKILCTKNIAPIGMSNGEDKLIGPKIWKDNPQSMKGCVISSGDGDWVIAVNYASLNKINVNPDPTTYDANAINFVGPKDDDYINSVKELIASKKNGTTVP